MSKKTKEKEKWLSCKGKQKALKHIFVRYQFLRDLAGVAQLVPRAISHEQVGYQSANFKATKSTPLLPGLAIFNFL